MGKEDIETNNLSSNENCAASILQRIFNPSYSWQEKTTHENHWENIMTSFIADDGDKIHLKISGKGSPVVLLHGWTSSHQEWFPFVESLEEHHTVYRWDARGHGQHPPPQHTMPTLERMAQDLHNLIDHYQTRQVTLVGHSMGALTIWHYLREFGCQNLARVAFIDQSPRLMTDDQWSLGIYGRFNRESSDQFIESLRENFAESVLRLTAHGLNPRARRKYEENATGWQNSRRALQLLHPAPLIACWESIMEADYRDVLQSITIPALLIYGGNSNFYHTDTAHYVSKQIPHARLRIYEGTDHSPHQWQRQRFVDDLLAFLNES